MKDRGNERVEFLPTSDAIKNVLIDLSFSGAAMNCHTEQKKDSRVSLKIRDYKIDATVIYCQGRAEEYRVGVHFINVAPDVQKSLRLMVEEFSRGVPINFEILEPDENKKA
jgi:hypothetical protein